MLDRDFWASPFQSDDHLPANLGGRALNQLGNPHRELVVNRVFHWRIVGRVGESIFLAKVLRSNPEPVPATNPPPFFIRLAGLLVHQLKNILAIQGPVGDNPRPHLQGNHDFDSVVKEFQVRFPTGKG